MPVKILSRKYVNPYNAEEVDWLIGNSGDIQKVSYEIRSAIEFKPNAQNTFGPGNENEYLLFNGKEWQRDYGIDVGDHLVLDFKWDVGNSTHSSTYHYTVISVEGSSIVVGPLAPFAFSFLDDAPYFPSTYDSVKFYNFIFYVDKRPEGIRAKYNHLQNSEIDSLSLASVIDGTESELSVNGLELLAIDDTAPVIKIGTQSGMSIMNSEVTYKGKTGTHEYDFVLDIWFMISSFYENELNFINNVPPVYLEGDDCLTDILDVSAFPEWNNPNLKIKTNLASYKRLGNTGWVNQNFNELDDNYEVVSVEYFDIYDNPIQSIDYANPTKVKAIVKGFENLSAGDTRLNFGFMLIAKNEEDFKNKETSFYQNVRFCNGTDPIDPETRFFLLDAPVDATFRAGYDIGDGSRMNSINTRFTTYDTESTLLETTLIPAVEFTNLIEEKDSNDREFILFMNVSDYTLDTNNSDRVTKLLDHNVLFKNVVPVGPFDSITNKFYEHPDLTSDLLAGFDNYEGFIEDDVLGSMVMMVDEARGLNIQNILLKIEAVDTSNGLAFELENVSINTSIYPIVLGVQEINHETSRNFHYVDGYEKNLVTMNRDSSLDSLTLLGYRIKYGFKVRWEHWLERTGVPLSYYDSNEEHNALNNDWYLYGRHLDKQLKLAVYTTVIENGETVTYKNSYDFEIYDYDSNVNVDTAWEFFRVSDNSSLNIGTDPETGAPLGVIPEGEKVRVKITYTRTDGDWCGNVYSTTCIQIDRGSGSLNHRQISSVHLSESDCPLVPLDGETKLKLNLVSSNVVSTECILDGSLLVDAQKYALSGRIGCGNEGGIVDPGCSGMVYEDGDCIILENGNSLIVE